MSSKEVVQLSLYLLLAVRVKSQEVAYECESVTARLIASDEEKKGLAYDLILRHQPFLLFCRLATAFSFSVSINFLICLIDHIKMIHGHTLLTVPSIQHQLQEVSAPLSESQDK